MMMIEVAIGAVGIGYLAAGLYLWGPGAILKVRIAAFVVAIFAALLLDASVVFAEMRFWQEAVVLVAGSGIFCLMTIRTMHRTRTILVIRRGDLASTRHEPFAS